MAFMAADACLYALSTTRRAGPRLALIRAVNSLRTRISVAVFIIDFFSSLFGGVLRKKFAFTPSRSLVGVARAGGAAVAGRAACPPCSGLCHPPTAPMPRPCLPPSRPRAPFDREMLLSTEPQTGET